MIRYRIGIHILNHFGIIVPNTDHEYKVEVLLFRQPRSPCLAPEGSADTPLADVKVGGTLYELRIAKLLAPVVAKLYFNGLSITKIC
jgi:hypothetical protein